MANRQELSPAECCLFPGAWGQGHLPVALGEVQCRDVPGPSQPIQELLHSGHRIAVKGGDDIQLSEVFADVERAIRLWNHNDGASTGATGWHDDP